MALPSQAARNTRYRARSSRGMRRGRRRKGSGGKRLFALIVFAALVVVVWWNWPDGQGPPSVADAGTDANDRSGVVEPRISNSSVTPSRGTSDGNPASGRVPVTPRDDEKSVPVTPPVTNTDTDTSTSRELKLTDVGGDRTPVVREPDPTPGGTPATTPPSRPSSAIEMLVTAGVDAYNRGNLIQARDLWNRALHHPTASVRDQQALRQRLAEISDRIIFSKEIIDADPITDRYTIQSGDTLGKIVGKLGLNVDYRLIARLNGVSDPTKIRVGQTLKTVKGPFHAIISKTDYRLDLYADTTDTDGKWLYIRSFPVGLGEDNGTPYGSWRVDASRRLIDPEWVNPRTGEKFAASDPKNPIGDRWIPLVGTDEITKQLNGYGIHGTVEPDSIGQQRSMGCVRMLPQDVEWIYEFLSEDECQVTIVP